MRFLKILCLFSLLLSVKTTHAATGGTEVGVTFGIKNADYKDDSSSNIDFKSDTGFIGGAIATGEFGGMLFRTGAYYAARNTEVDAGSGIKADLEIAYIDIPVTFMYRFNEMLGVFAGPLFALKITDDCSGSAIICDGTLVDDIESFHTAASVGLNAKFHPNWSGEFSYEYGLSDVSKDTSVNSITINAIFAY